MQNIILVDDQAEIREVVKQYLETEGEYAVCAVASCEEARSSLANDSFDLMVLDLVLPGEDGLTFCRLVSEETDVPIIILTERGDTVDRIIGLEMGASDYLPKPFHLRELLARIRAVLRIVDSGKRPTHIIRTIRFRPEQYQSGLHVLTYFHSFIRRKYPDKQVTVSIEQSDGLVRMIIESETGEKEIVEKAL